MQILHFFHHLSSSSFHRKLQTFKQEASSALSHQGCVIITRCSSTVIKGKDHLTTRFHSLRSRFKSSAARARVRKKPVERRQKEADPSASALSGHTQTNTTAYDVTSETTDHDSHDDIDNIFASIGWWGFGIRFIQGHELQYVTELQENFLKLTFSMNSNVSLNPLIGYCLVLLMLRYFAEYLLERRFFHNCKLLGGFFQTKIPDLK